MVTGKSFALNKRLLYDNLAQLPREELLELVNEQDPQLLLQVNRIEWVFENKLRHLTWPDGSRVEGRPVTNKELAYLIDPPFQVDQELTRAGFTPEDQRKIHVGADPVMWAREYVNQSPRAYQIWMLRDPSIRKVLRAGRRLGKALALDTPIPTPSGWTTMGELEPGDEVYSENGEPCSIDWVSPTYVDHDCFRVTFSDGAEIVADAGHLWTVSVVDGEAVETITTGSLRRRMRMNDVRYAVPDTTTPDGEFIPAREIVDISRVESVPVKCISVTSASKLFLAGREMVPTHNSYTMALTMLHWAYTKGGSNILVMAPVKEQAGLLYKAVLAMCKDSEVVDGAITRRVTSPQYKLEFSNGSIISFFTTGMKSGGKSDTARGQEADLIILDEMDYMGPDDLTAIYVMLQETSLDIGESKGEGEEKVLIGASTPTGLRGKFWEWCNSPAFKEFWFPSFVNPSFTKATEDEFREEYDEMDFRHEVEADWGESADGVYARRYVDLAFLSAVKPDQDTSEEDLVELKRQSDWEYENPEWLGQDSKFVMGVDWDKFGAGPNICVLEIPGPSCEDPRFAGRMRIVFREEVKRSDFVLIETVDRIIYLNSVFNPEWIYVDRGFGDVQIELLHTHGVENPASGLRGKVKGISFGGSIEVRDPATKQMHKKPTKPFMVENLRWILERGLLAIPSSDDQLWEQLTHYVVYGFSTLGSPKFQMADPKMPDHAHDALMLACLAYKQDYDNLMKSKASKKMITLPNSLVLPAKVGRSMEDEIEQLSTASSEVRSKPKSNVVRGGSSGARSFARQRRGGRIQRKMF